MSSIILRHGAHSTPVENPLYHSGRIKITSPDQYVPLFLSNYAKFDNGIWGWDILASRANNGKQVRMPYRNEHSYNILRSANSSREVVKAEMVKALSPLLNSPVPKEYTYLDISRNYNLFNYNTSNISSVLRTFTDPDNACWAVNNPTHVMLGLYMYAPTAPSPATSYGNSNPAYKFLTTFLVNTIPTYKPQILVVVKYKYLKMFRAMGLLRFQKELPEDAIKVLRVKNFADSNYGASLLNELPEGATVEYTTSEEILKYLIKAPAVKTPEQYLKDALRVHSNPEPHVVF